MKHETKTIREVTSEMLGYRIGVMQGKKYVEDWKAQIPEGSRWHPGDPGDPFCEICDGTGWLRMDLPIHHPDFGHLFLCSCVSEETVLKAKKEDNERAKKMGIK